MPTALDKLIATPPPDYSGARASNRFAYQRDWTFCLLLRLQLAGDDYLVVCDYHDDVLVLNHDVAPTSVDFYQIKTATSRRWTTSGLLARRPGANGPLPSILGKLYRHRVNFAAEFGSLNFVSNLYHSIELKGPPPADSRPRFTAEELCADELTKVINGIKAELSLGSDPIIDTTLVFHVSDLSLSDHVAHAKGKLVEYLGQRDPTREFPIQALYQSIADEIQRRADDERPFTAIVDFVNSKGFSRTSFEKILTDCLTRADGSDPRRVEKDLGAQLASEGLPFGERIAICRAIAKYGLERLDSSRADLRKWASQAKAYVTAHLPQHRGTLREFLSNGKFHLTQLGADQVFPGEYIEAILAWEVMTDGGAIPTVSS